MNERYTITFTYEELDTLLVALTCYQHSIIKEREGGRKDNPERAAQVLAAIYTAEKKIRARHFPKQPDNEPPLTGTNGILEYAQKCGNQAAADLLLLLGPGGFDGDYDAYNELEARLSRGDDGEGGNHDPK